MKNTQLVRLAGLFVLCTLATSITSNALRQQPQNRALSRREVPDDQIDEDDLDRASFGRGWMRDCLDTHNKYRKFHGIPPLLFSRKIARFAEKRASHIAASDGAEFRHPPDLPYGENLAWHSRSKTTCNELVKMWYDEIRLYNFEKPTFTRGTGHFTQLVWLSTRQVGCARGISKGPRGGVTLVCNYYPPGNMLGAFKEMVKRPITDRDTSIISNDSRVLNSNKKRKKNPDSSGQSSTPSYNPITSVIGSIFGGSSRSALDNNDDDSDDSSVTKPYKKIFQGFTENPFTSFMGPQLNQSSREGRSFNFESRLLNSGFSRRPPSPLPVTKSYITRVSSTTTLVSNSTTTTTTSYVTDLSGLPKKVRKKNPNNRTKKAKKLPKPQIKPLEPKLTSSRPKLSDATGGVATASKSTTTTTTTTTSTTKKPPESKPDSKPSSSSLAVRENDQLKKRNLVVDKDKSTVVSANSTAKLRARKRRRRAKNNAMHNNSTGGNLQPSNVRPSTSARPAGSKLQLTSLPSNSTTSTTANSTTKWPSVAASSG